MLHIYMGKSAAGKDTIIKRLLKENPKLKRLVTWTTRPMRDGEKQDVDYHFASDSEFDKNNKAGKFTENRTYNTLFNGIPAIWKYGTPRIDISGEWIIALELEGTKAMLDAYNHKDIEIVYVDVPDDIREQRARKRGTFSESEWNRRLVTDNEMFTKTNLKKLEQKYGRPIKIIKNI